MRERPQLFGKIFFVDLLLGMLIVMTALARVERVADDEEQKKQIQQAHLATDGLYAVVMTWPDGSNDDVDLYVKDPLDNVAFFQNHAAGLMHLENDDLGSRSDTIGTAGGTVKVDKNEERIIIRGAVNGEYVVNAQMYDKRDSGPVRVTVKLYLLRGSDTEIKSAERVMNASGDEFTAFRFSLDAGGNVTGYSDLPLSLVHVVNANGGQAQGAVSPMGGP